MHHLAASGRFLEGTKGFRIDLRLAAYMVSQNVDLWSFLKLKQLSLGQSSLPFRAWVSMTVGQLIDTIIFLTIAFYGTDPIGSIIAGQYFIKVIFATITTPLVSLAVAVGRNLIGNAHPRANLIPEESSSQTGRHQ